MQKLYTALIIVFLFGNLASRGISMPSEKDGPESRFESSPDSLISEARSCRSEAKYLEAIELYESASGILLDNKDYEQYIECKLNVVDILCSTDKTEYALKLIDSINELASKEFKPTDLIFSDIFYYNGVLELQASHFSEAKQLLEQSLTVRKTIKGNKDTLLARVYNKYGNYFFYTGDYKQALEYYQTAFEIVDIKKSQDAEPGNYLINMAIIHDILGEIIKSHNLFLKALEIQTRYLKSNDLDLGNLYFNFGRHYLSMDNQKKALEYFNNAEKIFLQFQPVNSIKIASLYWNKALIFIMLNDYDKSLTYLFKAYYILSEDLPNKYANIDKLMIDIGLAYELRENYDLAIFYYSEALKSNDYYTKIKTYRNLARLYSITGSIEQAKKYYNLSLKICHQYFPKNSTLLAQTYLHYGSFLQRISDERSINYLTKALSLYKKIPGENYKECTLIYFKIGQYFQDINDYQQALHYTQMGINYLDNSILNNAFDPKVILENLPLDNYTADLIKFKANTLLDIYEHIHSNERIIAAVQTYELYDAFIQKYSKLFKSDYSKTYLAENVKDNYNNAIDACYQAFIATQDSVYLYKAFNFAERSKAMILLGDLQDEIAREQGKVPEFLKEKENDLKSMIGQYHSIIYEEEAKSEKDKEILAFYRNELFRLEASFDSLTSYIEKKYPDYYALKYAPMAISIQNVQQNLKNDEALLEYSLSEDKLFCFRITNKEIELVRIMIDSNFRSDISSLIENLELENIENYNMQDFKAYMETAYRLYNALFQSVKGLSNYKKIYIIPDDEIGYLSFDMLIDSIPDLDTCDFTQLPYLVRKFAFCYSGSASLLINYQIPVKHKEIGGVLALAPTYDELAKGSLTTGIPGILGFNLPGAQNEIRQIFKYYNGKKIAGASATESSFTENAGNYNIIHLAMHTCVSEDNPLSSELVFSDVDDTLNDGVLRTYEISNMKLKGNLAVLSACSTGNGKLAKGEGILSLARAFTIAGIPGIIMTLWDVEDYASGRIIDYFYKYLSKGNEKDVALQLAKLNYIQNSRKMIEAHPRFWAGYVLYGNKDNISTVYITNSGIRLVSILLVLLLMLIFVLKKIIFYFF